MKPYLEIEKYSEAHNLIKEFQDNCRRVPFFPPYVDGLEPMEWLIKALKYANNAVTDENESLKDRIEELEGLLEDNGIDF